MGQIKLDGILLLPRLCVLTGFSLDRTLAFHLRVWVCRRRPTLRVALRQEVLKHRVQTDSCHRPGSCHQLPLCLGELCFLSVLSLLPQFLRLSF